MSGPRHAVYFAPAHGSAWWAFGAGWLGRDERGGAPLPQPALEGVDPAQLAACTAAPRRYGFHATLKAPMRLRVPAVQFVRRVEMLARGLHPIALRLELRWLDGFLALTPVTPDNALQALATRCAVELDDLRAPMDEAERARRAPDRLDVRGRELLEQYGYPLVLERFRFHMTLTGDCDEAVARRLQALLAPRLRKLQDEHPLVLDRLCVFREPAPGADFLREHDLPFG